MIVEHPFCITNASGDEIRGDLRYLPDNLPRALIVICHGFTAHKNWGPFPYIGRKFAEGGFASIVFNFSHNGIGKDFRKFSESEKFSRNTIGKELEDIRAVIDAVSERVIGDGVAVPERIGIVGHSRGGGVALLASSYDRRIKAVAAWSTVSTFHRYTKHQRDLWELQGFLPLSLKSSRTHLRFGIEVLKDLERNRKHYDLQEAVRRLQVPLLLVHGDADVSVRLNEPRDLYENADKTKTELVIMEHAGHMFGANHPFTESTPAIEHVAELTARWFNLHL